MKPKYLKQKKTSKLSWVLVGIIVLLVSVIAVMQMLIDKDAVSDQPTAPETYVTAASDYPETSEMTIPKQSEAEETTVNEGTAEDDNAVIILEFENGEIQTPYLTLVYPESFADFLLIANTSRNPYVLEFYAVLPEKMEQRIFDVCLGLESDGNLGIVATDAGEIPVSMTVYSFAPDDTWDEGEIDTILAMQEAANELILGLGITGEEDEINAPVLKETPEETTVVNFMQIDTPYCLLQYPAIWADWLHIEHTKSDGIYRVEFYCDLNGHEALLMFTVLFGGDEGEQLGVVTNEEGVTVPVNILMNTPSEDGLPENEKNILYSMQEALNLLIQQLPLQ